jgi:plastocyanin
VIALVAVVTSLLATASPPTPTAAAPSATAVGMSAREFSFGVYRTRVPAGRVRFNLHNFGEDAHDLQVRGPHGYRSTTSPEVEPGDTLHVTVRLRRPGRYTLLCTLPGHAARGMVAHLTVRRPR